MNDEVGTYAIETSPHAEMYRAFHHFTSAVSAFPLVRTNLHLLIHVGPLPNILAAISHFHIIIAVFQLDRTPRFR